MVAPIMVAREVQNVGNFASIIANTMVIMLDMRWLDAAVVQSGFTRTALSKLRNWSKPSGHVSDVVGCQYELRGWCRQ